MPKVRTMIRGTRFTRGPRTMITENQVGEILSRTERGESVSSIARTMKLTRPTVRKYANLPEPLATKARTHQHMDRSSSLQPYQDLITQLFIDTEGNCVNVLEILRDKNIECSLRTLQWYCKRIGLRQTLKNRRAQMHVHRIETGMGEEVQIDFGEKVVFVNGIDMRIHFFVATLGFSRKTYVRFYFAENHEAWLDGLERSFFAFSGVPRTVVCDNAKALVYRCAGSDSSPQYNRQFQSFCNYWHIRPVACRPHTPEHKGKVERAVEYIKQSFLKNFRKFLSLEDIQRKCDSWLEDWADNRSMHTADGIFFSPANRFLLEKERLVPISKMPIAKQRHETRIVGVGGFITVENKRYELPGDLANLQVELMIGTHDIAVIYRDVTILRLNKTTDSAQSMTRFSSFGKEFQIPVANDALFHNPLARDLSVYEEIIK